MSSLRSKTVKGIASLTLGKGVGRLISFVNTLILARILSPEDYGLMALAMVVCGFITFFNEIGLGSAIIQKKHVSKNQLNGAFSISIILSLFLYVFTYFFAPIVGEFYQNVQIGYMLQWLALSFVFGAFATVSNALITKNMLFKALAGVELISIVVQVLITLLFALKGYKAWSLVYGHITSQFFRAALIMYLAQWRPTAVGCFKDALELMKFGLTVTYSRLMWYTYSKSAIFIIGKVSGEKQLGIYSMASTLAGLPTAHITSLVGQVTSSTFAKLQEAPVELNKALLGFSAGIAMITAPILAGLAVTANELIPILLGEQWLDVIFLVQVMALSGFIKALTPLLTQALTYTGQANITAKYTTICSVLIPLAVLIGAMWQGINGVAMILLITNTVLAGLLLLLCKKHIQLNVSKYLYQLRTPLISSLVMALAVLVIRAFLTHYVDEFSLLLLEILFGVVIYCLWLIYVQTTGLSQLKAVLLDLGLAKQKLDRWPFNRVSD